MRIGLLLASLFLLTGCMSPYMESGELAEFSNDSVAPGQSVHRGEKVVELERGAVDLRKELPNIQLTDSTWNSYKFAADGKVKIISVVPSIDTRVCEQQTHLLSETETVDPKVQRITLSRDLPAAQARFAQEAGMNNITFVSDYKDGSFGKAAGLLMKDSGLLARAVLVVDQQGKVRYLQIVPDITKLPNMAKAIEVANSLAL